jgi:peptide/nickel transport system substrate-binding protein
VKRAALFIRMNDLLVREVVVIPIVWRHRAQGVSSKLRSAEVSGWDSTLWGLARWYREG